MEYYHEVEDLTLQLVKIPSVNNTIGEVNLANKILEYLRDIDYLKEHQEQVFEVHLKNDHYGRKNVFAYIEGKASKSTKTIILHGHMDTVGVEDFGELESYAFDPLRLQEKLKEVDLADEVREDLESGDWLFGRGTNDMKSGVAAHLVLFKKLSELVDKISGNILFMANPVEENQHTGIIESVKVLHQLKAEKNFDYTVAINNDYTTALSPDDKNNYVYLGTVGKLLPCFYIVGKETHVGQCFEGLDPNLIGAEILRRINLNADLCDEYRGEYTLPPTALKLTDLKSNYNVQMPFASYLYFNYFLHNISVEEVIERLVNEAELAFKDVIRYLNNQFKSYCKKINESYQPLPWEVKVTTFDMLYNRVKGEIGDKVDGIIKKITDELKSQNYDTRDIGLEIVKKLKQLSKDQAPEVILFFSPPYCPHNTVKDEQATEITDVIQKEMNNISKEYDINIEILRFFPSLSDSSYLKVDDDDASIESLIANFPSYESIYNLPLKEMKALDIPAINFGCYGKDAHKKTERVYKPYSFEILPKLTYQVIEKLFMED